MRALPLPFKSLGDSAAERNRDSVIYWKSRSAPTSKNSSFLWSLILSSIAFQSDIKSSSVAAILEACLNSHLSADVAKLCTLLCKFPPDYKVCTHREASLCFSPVPSGLCLSVCEVGGFMWPPCCCTILVHVAWAKSHMAWAGCCEPQPLSSVAFAWKGRAQCGSAPSRINTSLSWCSTALHTWILPNNLGSVGKAAEIFELFFCVLCSSEPVSTLSFIQFRALQFIHSCAPTK